MDEFIEKFQEDFVKESLLKFLKKSYLEVTMQQFLIKSMIFPKAFLWKKSLVTHGRYFEGFAGELLKEFMEIFQKNQWINFLQIGWEISDRISGGISEATNKRFSKKHSSRFFLETALWMKTKPWWIVGVYPLRNFGEKNPEGI